MAFKTLQIRNLLDQGNTPNLMLVLFAINGVASVDFVPGPNHVNVVFDEDLTSPDELATTLRNAGHPVNTEKPVKEAVSCCGGCCS